MTTTQADPLAAAAVPAALFQGYDSFSGKSRATAVAGEYQNTGGQIRCDYTTCTSTESLLKALNVSSDVAANFGAVNVEAKAEYVNRLEITETTVVVAVYSNVILGTRKFTTVGLAPDIVPPDPDTLNDFFHAYGDSWVSGLTLGGEYIASYVFYSQSVEEQNRVVAALKVKGVGASGQVTVGAQTAVEEVAKKETVRTTFKQQVFGFTNLALPKPDELVNFALGFSTRTPDVPTVVDLQTSGYEHVPGMSRQTWRPVRDTRDLFTSDIDGLSGDVVAILGLIRQIKWLRDVYATYGYTGDADLLVKNKQVEVDRGTLRALIDAIRNDPTKTYERPELPSLSYGTPVLKVSTPATPVEWGRNGGDVFADVTRQMILDQHALSAVTLQAGAVIDRITSTFAGREVRHGGDGGKPVSPLVLQPGEFITKIEGRSGAYVDKLTLHTSEGQTRTAGRDGGDPFPTWTVPPESVVVGFAGRSARVIDRLGPMTCTFSPAAWQPA